MSIEETHSLAIEVNEVWEDVKYLKSHFTKEGDFYNFIITAIKLSKVADEDITDEVRRMGK